MKKSYMVLFKKKKKKRGSLGIVSIFYSSILNFMHAKHIANQISKAFMSIRTTTWLFTDYTLSGKAHHRSCKKKKKKKKTRY